MLEWEAVPLWGLLETGLAAKLRLGPENHLVILHTHSTLDDTGDEI